MRDDEEVAEKDEVVGMEDEDGGYIPIGWSPGGGKKRGDDER